MYEQICKMSDQKEDLKGQMYTDILILYYYTNFFLRQFCPRGKGATNPRSTLGVVTPRVRHVPSGSFTSHTINCEELWDLPHGSPALYQLSQPVGG